MNFNRILNTVARGGSNQRGRKRRSNRPRGEGAGLIPVVRKLFRRR
jgi:hypothetical protein